ncbi:MAG TPA: cation-translocating P-type ATPase [Firmicutes bacterium]|nr:cation-translocating P-type ATPase [Candidatus Fermentithermobacillaceae bacterium]
MTRSLRNPHEIPLDEVEERLDTSFREGLSSTEARRRLKKYGPNAVRREPRKGFFHILADQWKDLMVLTLMAATVISALMGEGVDAAVIAFIVILNTLLGAIQEYKAEKALEALEKFIPPVALVLRDGVERTVPADEVVPGDVMILRAGMRAVADARLFQCQSLRVDESSLTGESVPVSKHAGHVCSPGTPLAERKSMIYAGTLVVGGGGRAVVTATGDYTEIGRIASLIGKADPGKTPLEKRLNALGKFLLGICLAIAGCLGVVGLLRGHSFHDMLLLSVSLAVAAVPEGLPAIVTLCLAMGVQRLARHGAVVRKLEAIETLGSVTVICTDKTGTITKNRMEVALIAPAGVDDGEGRARKGPTGTTRTTDRSRELEMEILRIATLASDALAGEAEKPTGGRRRMPPGTSSSGQDPLGEDPTEKAIVTRVLEMGIDPVTLRESHPRLGEKPFSSERRMMTTKVRYKKGALICVKGAPDTVIPLCSRMRGKEEVRTLGEEDRRRWEAWVNETAAEGIRILAVACKETAETVPEEEWERDLTFLGCIGLVDPPRPEARKTVERCAEAGIRVVLVTGDHLRTAESVARSAGIAGSDETGLTGADLDGISESTLPARIAKASVFARVSPAHKLRIVRALKKAGHVVAMTGDGINDAPALKEAAVGVAMGAIGTDVARESASVILLDDNLSTMVRAIEEGRAIYDNIRKFIRYLLSCNLGEILTMVGALILELPLPLTPVQLLWMNLVTDGLPALALSVDPPAEDLMKRKPRDPRESLVSPKLLRSIARRGLYIGGATLLIFFWALGTFGFATASTMAFATLVTAQLASAFDARSEDYDITELRTFPNTYLIVALLVSWLGLLAVVQCSYLAPFFNTVPLGARQWGIVTLASILPQTAHIAFTRRPRPSRSLAPASR